MRSYNLHNTPKGILLSIIKTKECHIGKGCSYTYIHENGLLEFYNCPLLNKFCTYKWEGPGVEYWPGEPRHEVERHPEFVQKAIEIITAAYGEGSLFDALL